MQLKNVGHSFDVGIHDVGVTIRKGEKWSKVPIGTELELWNCPKPHSGDCPQTFPTINISLTDLIEPPFKEIKCRREGTGKIIGRWVGIFEKLPLNLVKIEHNLSARNYDVLVKMLQDAYGIIKLNDIVTALIYERIE